MKRYFLNSPMLADHAAVEAYADCLGALRIGGYTADDGTHRAMVEITADVAAHEIAVESERIERKSRELRDAAERLRS